MTGSFSADFWIAAILGLFGLFIIVEMRARRLFMFDPMIFFWAGAIVIYVLDPLSGFNFYAYKFGEQTVVEALFWVWVSLIFLMIGYWLPWGRRIAQAVPEPPARLDPNLMGLGAGALILLGCLGWYMQIMTAGSFAAWGAVSRGGEDWEQLSGYVTLLASFLVVGVSVLVLHVEMHKRGLMLKVIAWVLLALLLLFFMYLGSRSRTIAIVGVALMAWSLTRRKNPSLTILLPLFAFLYVFTAFQAEYRGYFKNFSFNLDQIQWSQVPGKILPSFLGGDDRLKSFTTGSEFGMTVATVQLVPEQIDYNYGYEFLQIVTHPIPRALWPDKPYPRGETWSRIHEIARTSLTWVRHVKTPYLGGPSPAYTASWYYIGGIFGLFIGGIFTGVMFAAIRGIHDRSRNNEGFLVLFLILAPIGFSESSSHPLNWIFGLPLLLIPLLIIMYLIKTKPRQPAFRPHHR